MFVLATYRIVNGIDFIAFKKFTSEVERDTYLQAMSDFHDAIVHCDADPFMIGYKIPEQLMEIEHDDDIFERCEAAGIPVLEDSDEGFEGEEPNASE